ncbi:hypothetical protein COP2_018833 [Malus domestica]
MLARANAIKEEEKVVKLYSRHLCSYDDGNNSTWGLINLEHPATFETMAMDPELKKMIAEDLDSYSFFLLTGIDISRGVIMIVVGVTLGLLNFIDGLWSSFGDERIIVFTTNKKDRLDPALLRPG